MLGDRGADACRMEPRQPHGVAERYVENLQHSITRCYNLLSDQDRKDRTLPEFLTEIPLAPDVGPAWFGPCFTICISNRPRGPTATATLPSCSCDHGARSPALGAHARRRRRSRRYGAKRAQRSLDAATIPKSPTMRRYTEGTPSVAGGCGLCRSRPDRRSPSRGHREYHEYQYAKVIADYKSMIANSTSAVYRRRGLAARYRGELAAMQKCTAQQRATTAYMPRLKLAQVSHAHVGRARSRDFRSITNTGDPSRLCPDRRYLVEGRGQRLRGPSRRHPVVITPIEFTDFTVRYCRFYRAKSVLSASS